MVLGRKLGNLLGRRTLHTPGFCACALVITEFWSQPESAGLLLPEPFLRSYFVPDTVFVARDIDNSSHLLSIDSARLPLRADAIAYPHFLQAKLSLRRNDLAKQSISGRVRIQTQLFLVVNPSS